MDFFEKKLKKLCFSQGNRLGEGKKIASFLGAVWLAVLLVLGRWLAAADGVSAPNFYNLKKAKNAKKPTFSKGN